MSFSRREEYLYKLSTQSLSKLLFHLFFNGSFRDIMLFSAGINLICTKHSYSYLHSFFFSSSLLSLLLKLILLYSCSGEANAIVARAKARADGIQKVSLALQEQVLTSVLFIST